MPHKPSSARSKFWFLLPYFKDSYSTAWVLNNCNIEPGR